MGGGPTSLPSFGARSVQLTIPNGATADSRKGAQVGWSNSVNTLRGGNASEKPRHVFREAGLIISSDLCPVTPGSCTRLSTSLQFALMSVAWSIDDQLA